MWEMLGLTFISNAWNEKLEAGNYIIISPASFSAKPQRFKEGLTAFLE